MNEKNYAPNKIEISDAYKKLDFVKYYIGTIRNFLNKENTTEIQSEIIEAEAKDSLIKARKDLDYFERTVPSHLKERREEKLITRNYDLKIKNLEKKLEN